MADASVQDLPGLDREVARAAAALERWRADLEGDAEAAADRDPFEGARRGAATPPWDELGALPAPPGAAPRRDGLRRWIASLVQARLGGADDVARAREMASARGRLEGDPPRLVAWREAWRGVVGAKSVGETRRWLEAAGETAPPDRREPHPRGEARGGRTPPGTAAPLGSPRVACGRRGACAPPRVACSTRRKISRRPCGRSPFAERRRPAAPPKSCTPSSLARQAKGGPRASRRSGSPTPSARASGSSRSAFRRSRAWSARRASRGALRVRARRAPGDRPFVDALRREAGIRRSWRRTARPFSSAASPTTWSSRPARSASGGRGRRRSAASWRGRRSSTCGSTRRGCCSATTRRLPRATRSTRSATGSSVPPLDRRLLGAWPPARDDEPARWVALTQATAERHAMRERFDADWFRNPRAWSFLAAQGATPAHEPLGDGALDAGGAALAVALEEALA